jgi:hypothetical protein
MVVQVFISHTKLDSECCDKFDSAASRVGLRVFRSEFEKMESPAWKTIKDEINKSSALFLLVGKELVKAQALSETNEKEREKWKFTQNWIAYEIGVACQQGIDVWVICDSVNINFPVPYLNNYDVWGINREVKQSLDWIKGVFTNYSNRLSFPVGLGPDRKCLCPSCGAVFNLHSVLPRDMEVPCPTCLKSMVFKNGWLTASM